MKTYTFKNASITLTPSPTKNNNKNYLKILLRDMEAIKLHQNKKGELDEIYKEQLQGLRYKYKKVENTIYYDITIVLHKYKYKTTDELEVSPNSRLSIVVKEKVINAFKKYRRSLKLSSYPVRLGKSGEIFETYGSGDKQFFKGKRTITRVFSKPGQVYEKYIERKVKDIYSTKNPTTQNRYIGLEIEFCAPITKTALALKLFNAGVHKFAQMKEDGSLRPEPGETAFELAMLFRESSFKNDMKKVCNILKEVKAVATDRRCGLHVHLDMRHRDKSIVYSNLVACQPFLLSVVDPRRFDNEFCKRVESRTFPTKFNNTRQERYKTINAAAYYKYKTLEIRMHEGSVNYTDIVNWMSLLIKIANYKNKLKFDIKELPILKKRIKIDDKMALFFQDKSCYWQLNGDLRIPTHTPNDLGLRPLRVTQTDIEEPAIHTTEANRRETHV